MINFRKRKIAALTTDDNIYLSNDGGLTDNLVGMPHYEELNTTLNDHLTNIDNPHSEILSGLRTHQTGITLTQNIILSRNISIDCLLVQSSDSNDFSITIPNENTLGYSFATYAAFTAFRLGQANLTVIADSGVTFVNASGSSITLPTPGQSYYLFIRQNKNLWAVVTFGSGGSSDCCITKVNVTGSSQLMDPNTQYLANNPAGVTFTLEPNGTYKINDEIIVIGNSAWVINQNVSQQINVGSVSTTSGTGGAISSKTNYDCIKLICSAVGPGNTSTTFTAMVDQGNVLVQ
jgi:hypothetical protein